MEGPDDTVGEEEAGRSTDFSEGGGEEDQVHFAVALPEVLGCLGGHAKTLSKRFVAEVSKCTCHRIQPHPYHPLLKNGFFLGGNAKPNQIRFASNGSSTTA